MIFELQARIFSSVSHLFSDLERYYLVIQAVIEGIIPGRIWVDNIQNPKTAFLCDKWRFFLSGEPNNSQFNKELSKMILNEITPDAKTRNYERFSHHFTPESWRSRPDILLEKFRLKECDVYYMFNTHRKSLLNDIVKKIPSNLRIEKLSPDILENSASIHAQNLEKMISQYWGSVENFLENGFGFCLTENEKMICWCMTDYIVGNRTEVGVETHEEYRGRGFASITAAATVNHCLKKGIDQIGWQSWKSNIASAKTAKKLGFEKVGESVVYFAYVNDF